MINKNHGKETRNHIEPQILDVWFVAGAPVRWRWICEERTGFFIGMLQNVYQLSLTWCHLSVYPTPHDLLRKKAYLEVLFIILCIKPPIIPFNKVPCWNALLFGLTPSPSKNCGGDEPASWEEGESLWTTGRLQKAVQWASPSRIKCTLDAVYLEVFWVFCCGYVWTIEV